MYVVVDLNHAGPKLLNQLHAGIQEKKISTYFAISHSILAMHSYTLKIKIKHLI